MKFKFSYEYFQNITLKKGAIVLYIDVIFNAEWNVKGEEFFY